MKPSPETAKAMAGPAAARAPAALRRQGSPALARRVGGDWLARAAWTLGRTGAPGLLGLALLGASALFLLSTHLPVAGEVESLRAELASSQGQAPAPAAAPGPALALRSLPARSEVPALLGQLFDRATQAHLTVDTARYELDAKVGGGVVRHRIAFPVTGPYPRIRAFIDETLATMPAVALGGLAIERRSSGEGEVEAQIRLTLYTRSAP